MSRPIAAPTVRAISGGVSTSGPVMVSVCPTYPPLASTAPATAPMSPSCTIALRRSANPVRTTWSVRIDSAQSRTPDMNSTGWSSVHSRSLASTARCTDPGSPPSSMVTRRAPPARASSTSSAPVSRVA